MKKREYLSLIHISLEIDAKGQKIINVTYTVESTDGGALIENSVLKSFDEDGSYLTADFQLETAILMNQEYTLDVYKRQALSL